MKHDQYWRVKAALLERQHVEVSARLAVIEAQAKLRAVMVAAGLDPDHQYILSDDDESLTVKT